MASENHKPQWLVNESFLDELRIQVNHKAVKTLQKYCTVDDDRVTVCIMKAVTGLYLCWFNGNDRGDLVTTLCLFN